VTDDPYAATNMIKRLGGTVGSGSRGRHRLRERLRTTDEGVALQQTIRRGSVQQPAAAQ